MEAEEINRNIPEISLLVEQTCNGAKEVLQASVSVAHQASELQALMGKFQL